jgi:hypothetical protein
MRFSDSFTPRLTTPGVPKTRARRAALRCASSRNVCCTARATNRTLFPSTTPAAVSWVPNKGRIRLSAAASWLTSVSVTTSCPISSKYIPPNSGTASAMLSNVGSSSSESDRIATAFRCTPRDCVREEDSAGYSSEHAKLIEATATAITRLVLERFTHAMMYSPSR